MGAIEYNGYLITKEAKIFEICSNIEIEPTIHKTGKLSYLLDGVKTKIEHAVCEVLFGDISNSPMIQCDYLRGFCISDLFNNVICSLEFNL